MLDIHDILHNMRFDPALLYEAIVRSTDDYIYIGDLKQDTFLLSDNMQRDFGFGERIISGMVGRWGDLVHERDKKRYNDDVARMLAGETSEHNLEYQVRDCKGEYVWVHCRGILKRDSEDTPVLFAGVVTRLCDRGRVDPVTGLFTQMDCEEWIRHLLVDNARAGGGILLLGLDDFKRINNLRNHLFGNSVMRQFAQSVQQFLPDSAQIYRFDGDQFAIVSSQATRDELFELYQKIHAYANRSHEVDGFHYFCTVSAGIAMMDEDSDNGFDLIKFADSAMEEAKRRGKNTCCFFSAQLIESQMRLMELAELLQESVLHNMNQFRLVYQPLADLQTLNIHGAEALLRWSCDPFGQVPPMEFIPVLESNELIVRVGKWVLEEAIRTCKAWSLRLPDFIMNVNISYLQLLDDDFIPFVHAMLLKYSLDPTHLVLEMTESYFVTDLQMLKETFRALREMSVRIAMDDFGTGYSSLGLLSQSPADIVKIDRIFISTKDNAAFNLSFIGAVVKLCHSVGISVCVEGIEQYNELKIVRSLNADSIQGYYLSKPISKEDFEEHFLSPTPAR